MDPRSFDENIVAQLIVEIVEDVEVGLCFLHKLSDPKQEVAMGKTQVVVRHLCSLPPEAVKQPQSMWVCRLLAKVSEHSERFSFILSVALGQVSMRSVLQGRFLFERKHTKIFFDLETENAIFLCPYLLLHKPGMSTKFIEKSVLNVSSVASLRAAAIQGRVSKVTSQESILKMQGFSRLLSKRKMQRFSTN